MVTVMKEIDTPRVLLLFSMWCLFLHLTNDFGYLQCAGLSEGGVRLWGCRRKDENLPKRASKKILKDVKLDWTQKNGSHT